jgi:SWI/SNF-related matrix-associated actin-dependent regulator of chromatin subfamily A member 5
VEEKIIERAHLKLQLDAVVIQQGRLAQQSVTLSKDVWLAL